MTRNNHKIEFSPNNHIVQLCVQGIGLKGSGNHEAASILFLQAWNEATDDFEKFIAAHFVAHQQKDSLHKLQWLETALQHAIKIDNPGVKVALPLLYAGIAKCYEELNDIENAKKNTALANSFSNKPSDPGPFYHGTKADLRVGDELTVGNRSNYQSEVIMNHVYFTSMVNGAGLAAALAKGNGPERVYMVEPAGSFEHDPNLTNKKFPGNLTCSYRTDAPLKIIN